MDEHSGSLPQPSGDLHLLFPAVLPGPEAVHLALPRDPRGGPAGRRARVLGATDRLQG